MLRILSAILILSSCSMGTVKTGGDTPYIYDVHSEYNLEDLKELSSKIVETSQRDPQVGKLQELFGKGQEPLKRVGLIVFESEIQPTRDGLAGKNEIYLSEQGKQLLTEKLLSIWEQSVKIISPELDYVSTSAVKKSPAFHQYGLAEDDFIKANRTSLAPDDIFFLESSKKTTTTTVVNPRGMRDMAFVLVPAYELMGGPKWSEHNKHFVNDVAKSLKLDAVIIVMSKISWTAAHTDKHSGEFYPEQITTRVQASTLVPLHKYHERLEVMKNNQKPNVTLAFKTYDSTIKVPVLISVPAESKSFETIETELLAPMLKTYKDMSQMTLIQLTNDLKKTW